MSFIGSEVEHVPPIIPVLVLTILLGAPTEDDGIDEFPDLPLIVPLPPPPLPLELPFALLLCPLPILMQPCVPLP